MTPKSPRYSHFLIRVTAPQPQLSEPQTYRGIMNGKYYQISDKARRRVVGGYYFFPAPSWHIGLEKASFQTGFYSTSHEGMLIPATASGWHHGTAIIMPIFFVAKLKASLNLQRTHTCESLELFCGHNNRLQWEQDRPHWVLSCLRGKLKTNKQIASAGFSVSLNLWQRLNLAEMVVIVLTNIILHLHCIFTHFRSAEIHN